MQRLVKIYEAMKPKDAARIFDQLDMNILLQVVERMAERRVAPILADMSPKRANELTAEIASRRQMPNLGANHWHHQVRQCNQHCQTKHFV